MLLNWSYPKNIKMISKNKITVLILSLTILISCNGQKEAKFDSEKWKNWEETESTLFLRWEMRNDLLENHDLKGRSQKDVIKLLGEPENKSKDNFRYNLGPTGRGINYGTLILELENDTVKNYKIHNS
jgi:hypothetical protein